MDHVLLIGADDVRSAGNTISSAADTMRQAASTFDGAVDRLVRALDDHATRIEQAMESKP